MLQGNVFKWQDLGFRSCGLIKVGHSKIYGVDSSEVQPDETGKRQLRVGEVVAFEQAPDRVEKGKIYRRARKIIRPADIVREKVQITAEQSRWGSVHLEVQQQKDRAAERQRLIRRRMKSGGGYMKVILRDGELVVFGRNESELNTRTNEWGISR